MNQIFDININVMDNVNLDIIKDIEEKIRNSESLNDNETFYFLSYVSYKVRDLLSKSKEKNLDEDDFKDGCNRAQAMLGYYFNDLGLKNIPVLTSKIFFNVVRHFFIIVYIVQNGELKAYIVDPTYNQFFNSDRCLDSNFVIKDGIIRNTPDPGYFILKKSLDEQDVIKNFLNFGFMELNSENAKIYGDSFYFTQVGITEAEYENLFVPGNSYLKFFTMNPVELTKSEEELKNEGLFFKPIDFKENNNIKSV